MTWADFHSASALEREVLRRVRSLVPLRSDGTSRYRWEMADDRLHVSVMASDSLGSIPERCVELLQLRPLLFGAAWKVLDLVVDEGDESGRPAFT